MGTDILNETFQVMNLLTICGLLSLHNIALIVEHRIIISPEERGYTMSCACTCVCVHVLHVCLVCACMCLCVVSVMVYMCV